IGGLINAEDSKTLRKVPFLGDIPLLGNLFRKEDSSTNDKELIIFITPHLVKEGARTAGLAQKQMPWEYGRLGLKEEAMERILDGLER
ncbi:MAG: type II and III secretion system protein, partial [Candidatus Omnitrophica bacterium]|nr:type II and III secretion system protein [Candidatus Omnitrophota bacterium]